MLRLPRGRISTKEQARTHHLVKAVGIARHGHAGNDELTLALEIIA
jgi:hypothetical protein